MLIDVTRVGEVGDEVLRDRRHLAGDGLVVAVVAISRHDGRARRRRRSSSRAASSSTKARRQSLFARRRGRDRASASQPSSVEERTDQGLMTEKLRVELRRFFKKRSGRRPLVLPVLMEI